MGVARYVNLSFVAAGLLAWVVFGAFTKAILELISISLNRPLIGVNFRVADLVGLLAAGLLALYLKKRYGSWAMEVGNELSRVTWPTWSETRLATIVVIITTIVISLILGLFDYIWAQLSSLIYGF